MITNEELWDLVYRKNNIYFKKAINLNWPNCEAIQTTEVYIRHQGNDFVVTRTERPTVKFEHNEIEQLKELVDSLIKEGFERVI